MELKFECPTCGQHLSATPVQIGVTASCPSCNTAVTVPSSSTLPAPSPPSPPSRPAIQTQTRQPGPSARRHGIFYYVFWGTISLLATLVILFAGFVFLTGAGAAFLMGVSHHPTTTTTAATATTAATHNLPALTETETQQAQSLITTLHSKTDDIEGITWYSPDPADNYKTAVYLYIGKKQTGQPWLRWKIRYYGDDWLFIRRYRLKIENAEPVTVLPTKEIKRENSAGSVWETFDESADKHAHALNQMLAGNTTYLRMDGSEGDKDIQLGPEQLQEMRDVLMVFRYLEGRWPAN